MKTNRRQFISTAAAGAPGRSSTINIIMQKGIRTGSVCR